MWTATKTETRALLAVLLTAIALPAAAGVLSPFEAHYKVQRGSLGLGTTEFSLSRDGDCYRYHGVARPSALVSLFIGTVTDDSRFCVEDGQVQPQHYEHVRAGDAEDSYSLAYKNGQVTYKSRAGEARTFEAPADALDPSVIQIAARLWVAGADQPTKLPNKTFAMVDEDEVKHYELAVRDGGRIETPAGAWPTLLVERVDDPDRSLRFWLAPGLDWLPVKIEYQKKDDPVIRMTLEKLPKSPAKE